MDSRQLSPDAAQAAYVAALNRLARVAQLTQDFIESAKVAFAAGDATEIEEVKRDAAVLMEQHLAANRAVYETGLEYSRVRKLHDEHRLVSTEPAAAQVLLACQPLPNNLKKLRNL